MRRRYHMEEQELAAAEAAGANREPVEPRPAAGVVLSRDVPGGPEVLLVRRRPDVGFAAGAYVFPGGTLDAEDADSAWKPSLDEPPAAAVAGAADADGHPARSFVVAALRELFEETGVLLTTRASLASAELATARGALVRGERGFREIVSGLNVRLAGDRLLLCARWITPESISRRYDARFFLAEAPREVQVAPELGELVEHVWVSPREALERYNAHEFPMLFPTAVTLGWLETSNSMAEWFEHFLAKEITPILPRLRRMDGQVVPLMPGEPGYDDKGGDG